MRDNLIRWKILTNGVSVLLVMSTYQISLPSPNMSHSITDLAPTTTSLLCHPEDDRYYSQHSPNIFWPDKNYLLMLPSAWPCMLHLIIWTFFKISSGWRMTTNGSQVWEHESAGRPIGGQRWTALKISTISMWRSYTKWIPLHMGLSYTQPEAVNRNVMSAWLIFRKKNLLVYGFILSTWLEGP